MCPGGGVGWGVCVCKITCTENKNVPPKGGGLKFCTFHVLIFGMDCTVI